MRSDASHDVNGNLQAPNGIGALGFSTQGNEATTDAQMLLLITGMSVLSPEDILAAVFEVRKKVSQMLNAGIVT